jgi:hypothetical protein
VWVPNPVHHNVRPAHVASAVLIPHVHRTELEMGVWVQVLSDPWILDLTGTSLDSFLHPRLNPHKTGFECGFHFDSQCIRNPKNPEKNQKGTEKKPEKIET